MDNSTIYPHTYTLRITNNNQEDLYNYLKDISGLTYTIGALEIGEKTQKEHYHTIISNTCTKSDLLIKQLKYRKIILNGNENYSIKKVKQTNQDYETALSYAIKEGIYRTNLPTSMLEAIPKWIPKKEFLKNRVSISYAKLINNYKPIPIDELELYYQQEGGIPYIKDSSKKRVINHVFNYVNESWYGSLFTDEIFMKYVKNIIHHTYVIKFRTNFNERPEKQMLKELYKYYTD